LCLCVGWETFFEGFERFSRFFFAGVGDRVVVKIFPQRRMPLQMNDDGRFVAVFIDDELYALHDKSFRLNSKYGNHYHAIRGLRLDGSGTVAARDKL
jgi:hypothetical protein